MVIRFFAKILLLLLLVLCSILVIGILPREAILNIYMDKQQLLKATPAPRIILIGGSGSMYGLDSPCIEKAFGVPVINAGLHAGLSLRFLLGQVRPYIQPKDIVIVTPEYGVLSRGYGFNAPTTAGLVFTDLLDKAAYLSPRDYFEGLQGFPSVAFEKLVTRPINLLRVSKKPFMYPPPFFWRSQFNSNGDFIGHLSSTKKLSPESLKTYPPLTVGNVNDSIVMLNDFAGYATKQGAQVFIAFPPLVDARYQKYAPAIATIYDRLKQKLTLPILSPPSNYVYPIEYFYDTPEHLTAKGRKARTERLIADLKQVQPSIAPASTTPSTCAISAKP